MSEIRLDIIADDSQANRTLLNVANNLDKIDKQADETNKSLNDAFDPKPVMIYEKELEDARKEISNIESETKELERTNKKTFSSGERSVKRFDRAIRTANRSASALRGSFGRLAGAGGILGVVALVGSLISAFKEFGTEALDNLGRVGDFIRQLISLGRDLASTLTFGLIDSTAQVNAEIQKQTQLIISQRASLNKQIEVAEQERLVTRLRNEQATAQEILKAEQDLVERRKELNAEAIRETIRQQNRLIEEDLKIQAQIEANRDGTRGRELEKRREEIQTEIRQEDLKAAQLSNQQGALNSSLIKLETDFNAEQERLRRESEKREQELAQRREERAEARRSSILKTVAAIKKAGQDELNARRAQFAAISRLENELLLSQQGREEEAAFAAAARRQEEIDKNVEDATKRLELITANEIRLQQQLEEIRDRFANQAAEDLTLSSEEELARQQEFLEQQIALEESRLDAAQATEEEKERFQLESQKRRLQLLLEFSDSFTASEVETVRNLITAINAEIENLGQTEETGERKGFLQRLFPDLEDDQINAIRDGLNTVTEATISSIQEILNAREEAARREVQIRQQRIGELQSLLQAEIQLNEQGLASNIRSTATALEEQQKLRDEALKRQAEAQRAQIALETVTQATSLITASANIFASLSPIPFVGIPLAIAAISTLFGAFAVAKTQALQATAVNFNTGGLIENGFRDDNGGKGSRIQGTNMYVGRGEFITNRKVTKEHLPFLERLNKGEFKGVDLNSMPFISGAMNAKVSKSQEAYNANVEKERGHSQAVIQDALSKQTETLNQTLRAIHNKEQISIDKDGNIVYFSHKINGNKTTRVVKNGRS